MLGRPSQQTVVVVELPPKETVSALPKPIHYSAEIRWTLPRERPRVSLPLSIRLTLDDSYVNGWPLPIPLPPRCSKECAVLEERLNPDCQAVGCREGQVLLGKNADLKATAPLTTYRRRSAITVQNTHLRLWT